MIKKNINKEKIILPNSTRKYSKALVVACILLGIVPLITRHTYYIGLANLILVYGILAISVDLLSGYTGLSSLGHAGFFGFTAYTVGYLTTTLSMSDELAILIALVLGIMLALLFGILMIKIWGSTFLMVNIALGMVIWGLAYKLVSVTNGETGLLGIVRPTLFGKKFSDPVEFYYFTFVVFVIVLFLVYRLTTSPFGLTVLGIKQSIERMSALGFNVMKHKFIIYVISGSIAGLSGILYVYYFRFVSPTDCNIIMSSKAFLMALAGGTGTLVGPIIGSGLIVILENVISGFTDRWVSFLGILYIITIVASPKGIVGMYHQIAEKVKKVRNNKNGNKNIGGEAKGLESP